MDSITHIALGACMGEAFAGKTVGKKAMLWGALAQSIPDIDFLAAFWLDTSSNLLAHRGFTHSLLFAFMITPIMGYIAERLHRPHNISLTRWNMFFAAVILMHVFLDAFNNYGVGWFEPFSHYRVCFNVIFVADPFFSVWSGIAAFALLVVGSRLPVRTRWWKFGLVMSFAYLGYGLLNKSIIIRSVRPILDKKEIPYNRYFTTPAPLQNWLWFVVAGNDSGYYVGYRSVFDNSPDMHLEYFPRNEYLIHKLKDSIEINQLVRFSQQFYTVEQFSDTLVFNDLRFGQVIGWHDPREKFAFHYFLHPAHDNTLVVQRGRFAKWNRASFETFIQRIKGN